MVDYSISVKQKKYWPDQMWPDLGKWVVSRTLTKDAKDLYCQNHLDLTYFQFLFLHD